MDVEYYRKELKGIDRCLKPISAYLKGELDENLALLLAAYHRILTEEMYKKTMPLMFTKEGLQATGLMEESDNDNYQHPGLSAFHSFGRYPAVSRRTVPDQV